MMEDPKLVEIIPFEGPRDLATVTARPPALFLSEPKAAERFWEFFTANIRNRNTRRAAGRAVPTFQHSTSPRCRRWCTFIGASWFEVHHPKSIRLTNPRLPLPSVRPPPWTRREASITVPARSAAIRPVRASFPKGASERDH